MQEDVPEKMADTLKLWDMFRDGEYEVYLSTVTLKEIQKCPEPKRTQLIDYLNEIQFTILDITEDVELISILDKGKFKDLENILIEDYNIIKPLFTIDEDDTKIWNVINFVMKSDKEEPEKENESIENESVEAETTETTEVSDESLEPDVAE